MFSQRPLYGVVLALLPAAVVFAEVMRGTRTSHPWHPLAVIAFVWLLAAVAWWCWREHVGATRASPGGAGLRPVTGGTPAPPITGDDARATSQSTHLLAIALFMLGSLALHPILFALLTGGWGIPYKLAVNADGLYYGLYVALWIAVYVVLLRLPGQRFDFHLRLNRQPADIVIFAIFGLITWAVLGLYLRQLGGAHPPMEIFGVTKAADPAVFYTVGAIFSVVNALSEELWFRGLLLGALRGLLPMWPAILLQALCFGLAHWVGTPQGIFGFALAGAWAVALGWWTYRRGSLWQAFCVHLLADWLIFAYTNG